MHVAPRVHSSPDPAPLPARLDSLIGVLVGGRRRRSGRRFLGGGGARGPIGQLAGRLAQLLDDGELVVLVACRPGRRGSGGR